MVKGKVLGFMAKKEDAEKAVKELNQKMCGYTPGTLHHIKKYNPELAVLIRDMDQIMVNDGALDKKTKRLIALACVAVRMCEDCVYPQAKVAKKGLTQLFDEWEGEERSPAPKKNKGKK